MYLQKGSWLGNRILPVQWVAEATSAQVENEEGAMPILTGRRGMDTSSGGAGMVLIVETARLDSSAWSCQTRMR